MSVVLQHPLMPGSASAQMSTPYARKFCPSWHGLGLLPVWLKERVFKTSFKHRLISLRCLISAFFKRKTHMPSDNIIAILPTPLRPYVWKMVSVSRRALKHSISSRTFIQASSRSRIRCTRVEWYRENPLFDLRTRNVSAQGDGVVELIGVGDPAEAL